MYFVIFATDRPGMQTLRDEIRPAHRHYLRHSGHPVTVCLGGPTHRDSDRTMNGTLLVVEADTLAQVQAFVRQDPYVRQQLFATLEIRPWTCGLGSIQGELQHE